jgi:hypothetical protein
MDDAGGGGEGNGSQQQNCNETAHGMIFWKRTVTTALAI